jgi:hypothetical protein
MNQNLCPICEREPNSHSFDKIGEEDNITTYYTNIAKAIKYNDTEGIITHFDKYLQENGEKEWIWIFDSGQIEWKHLLDIHTPIQLAKLISNKYSNHLKKIIIIHPTWHAYTILYLIWGFLTDNVREVIDIDRENIYSNFHRI